jgi:hypothetical protein
LVYEKKRQFFRRKLVKIARNWDQYIDPWSRRYTKISEEKVSKGITDKDRPMCSKEPMFKKSKNMYSRPCGMV